MTAGRAINTKSQSWGTPLKYVNAVKSFFDGVISLDPCSNEYSIVHAQTEFILPMDDGLEKDWNYPTIYVNPPYGIDKKRRTNIKDWLVKCVITHRDYASEILALIPVATNTSHWKKCIFGQAAAICFLYDTRLKFLENGQDCGKGAPMACAMIYWGEQYEKFLNLFSQYGAVVDIRNLRQLNDTHRNGLLFP